MQRGRAFILIELLFVVAIIAILAAIAVPNFLEAQTRSKIARVRGDMASLHAALRAYRAQYDAYPPHAPATLALLEEFNKPAPAVTPVSFPNRAISTPYPFLRMTGWDLARLTTPVAWLSRALPTDPFQPKAGYPFVYLDLYDVRRENGMTTATRASEGFMLVSYGPDGELNLDRPVRGPWLLYDPTNGACSAGDLVSRGW